MFYYTQGLPGNTILNIAGLRAIIGKHTSF